MNFAWRFDGIQIENAYFFTEDSSVAHRQHPYRVDFSTDPGLLYWCSTVTYSCIQLAAYMGFKEIYLLGVDLDYSYMRKADGEIVYNSNQTDHFHSDYVKVIYSPDVDLQNAGYIAAKEYANKNDLRILNATRGGKLEIFERIDFNSLFN